MIGNEEDFMVCLGFEVEGNDENFFYFDVNLYVIMIDKVIEKFLNIFVVVMILCQVCIVSCNDWLVIVWLKDIGLVCLVECFNLEIFDCVGGGDFFVVGFVVGFMEIGDLQKVVELGVVYGVLVMMMFGDILMVICCEVELLVVGGFV